MNGKMNKKNKDEEFNERAAIMQYDADMSKEESERKALQILKKKYPDLIPFKE